MPDPTIESVLTVAGNAAITFIIVQVLLGALAVTGEARDRFGPLVAVLVASALAVTGEVIISLTDAGSITAEGIMTAVLIGVVAGWASMGIHDSAKAAGSAVNAPEWARV